MKLAGLKLVSLLLAAMLVFTGCGDKKNPVMGMDDLKVETNSGTEESATESTEEGVAESADGNSGESGDTSAKENEKENEKENADGNVDKNTDSILTAPAFTRTERIDNRYTEDGKLLVEGEFRGIEVSGQGYEAAAKRLL